MRRSTPAFSSRQIIPAANTARTCPVRRYTMALQAIRAMGFVGAAETVSTADLAFSDNAEIQDWVKGYVKLATQHGVMNGYPDGFLRTQTHRHPRRGGGDCRQSAGL